jgi:YesN/AraC family two-component response regulator
MSVTALNSGSRSDMESRHESPSALSILIVEDDTVTNELLGRIIAAKFPGLAVAVADNGRMGVELFKERAADIVITDMNMPEMDGIQMTGEIKAIKDDVKIIVLSGDNDTKRLEIFSELGIYGSIVKPIEFGKLFAMIERCIDEIRLLGQ